MHARILREMADVIAVWMKDIYLSVRVRYLRMGGEPSLSQDITMVLGQLLEIIGQLA